MHLSALEKDGMITLLSLACVSLCCHGGNVEMSRSNVCNCNVGEITAELIFRRAFL